MRHDFDDRMKRDAALAEREAPHRMMDRLRESLERERAPEPVAGGARGGSWVAAAAVVLSVGALMWALNAMGRKGGDGASVSPTVASTAQAPVGAGISALTLPGPVQGLALASRASEPLSHEWESMKSDSLALVRGFERQIPRIPARD